MVRQTVEQLDEAAECRRRLGAGASCDEIEEQAADYSECQPCECGIDVCFSPRSRA